MILLIVSFVLFLVDFAILFTNFYSMPLSFVPYPSMVDSQSTETHYIWNMSLYTMFAVQHIVMATINYKLSLTKIWKHYALYERYIFNIASGVALWIIFAMVRPSNHVLFVIPDSIIMPMSIIGLLTYVGAMITMTGLLFMPFSLKELLGSKTI